MPAKRLCIRLSILVIFYMFLLAPLSADASGQIYTGMYGAWGWENFDSAFQLMHDNGFQLAVVGPNKDHLDMLQAKGMKGIVSFDVKVAATENSATWQMTLDNIKAKVTALKDHPAVFAWYLVDEPDVQNFPVVKVKEMTKLVRKIDPSKPLYTVLIKPEKWKKYFAHFDIIAEDKYIDKSTNSPEVVRDHIRRLKRDLMKLKLRKRVWAVLGALDLQHKSGISNYHRPTSQEFTTMVDIAMQEKVEGIMVYTLAFKNNSIYKDWNLPEQAPSLWEAVKMLPLRIPVN